MNFKKISMVALVAFFATGAFAENKLKVIDEYKKVKCYNLRPIPTNAQRKQTLEQNLASAIKNALVKDLDSKTLNEKTKDLKLSALKFNRKPGTYSYYVKFDKYMMMFSFAANPELSRQLPIADRVFDAPEAKELERAEKAWKKGADIVFETNDSSGDDSSDNSSANPPPSDATTP